MDHNEAMECAKRLADSYPMQHIGESTTKEMAREFLVVDVESGNKVVDALKGRSAWYPPPYDVRRALEAYKDGGADLGEIAERETDIVQNIARNRGISYASALARRREAIFDYLQEALACNLESAGYHALHLRVLKDMERRQVMG